MAENLINKWASRLTRFIYLGDQAKAAEWKQFALKKKNQLLNIGNGSPLSHHIEPNADTKISYRTNELVDTIIIEVGGGTPHGIAMTPCTSLSPQGFGIPLLGEGDTWGSSGVTDPNAYVPPITHPSGGKAWQLAFLSHDGKGKKVPAPPKVMHGRPWATLVGPSKVDGTGHSSDLRYGGSQGVAIHIGREEKPTDTMVFSVKGSRTIWGFQPAPTPSRLYLDGKPFAATRVFMGVSAPVTEAIALGKRDKTLILVCRIGAQIEVFTAQVGKRPKSLVFQHAGPALEEWQSILVSTPNFFFNAAGTRFSAVVPINPTGGEVDTAVVHVDLDGQFSPTSTIEPISPASDSNPGQEPSSGEGWYLLERIQLLERPIACCYDGNDLIRATVEYQDYFLDRRENSYVVTTEYDDRGPFFNGTLGTVIDGSEYIFRANESSKQIAYKINGAIKAKLKQGSNSGQEFSASYSAGPVRWTDFPVNPPNYYESPEEAAASIAAYETSVSGIARTYEVTPATDAGGRPSSAPYNFYCVMYRVDNGAYLFKAEILWERRQIVNAPINSSYNNQDISQGGLIRLFATDLKNKNVYTVKKSTINGISDFGLYENEIKLYDIT